jgi:hypothetical protein
VDSLDGTAHARHGEQPDVPRDAPRAAADWFAAIRRDIEEMLALPLDRRLIGLGQRRFQSGVLTERLETRVLAS